MKKITLILNKSIILIPLLFLIICKSGTSAQVFSKVHSDKISFPKGYAFGAGWLDINCDNYLDIFYTTYDKGCKILINNKDGSFSLSDNSSFINLGNNRSGITLGDVDNNGFNDFLVMGESGKNILLSNSGNGNYNFLTNTAFTTIPQIHFHGSFVDYDNDGWLDLFVPTASSFNWAKGGGTYNYLYHNNGDGTFSANSNSVITKDAGNNQCGNFADFDNDGDMDLFVTEWQMDNWFYENNGDGTFTKITGTNINTNTNISLSCCWGDYDNDGFMDLFVANGAGEDQTKQQNFLFHNNSDKTFTKVTNGDVVNSYGNTWTCMWADIDNDGDIDLFTGDLNDVNAIYINDGQGTLTKTNVFDTTSTGSTGAGFADYDNDGFVDLFTANAFLTGNTLYHNNGNTNNWINITCRGTLANKSAIGARVKIKARIFGNSYWQIREINGNMGTRSVSDLRAHFGLGDAEIIDSLIIEWPFSFETVSQNRRTIKTNIPVNQFITITEDVPIDYLGASFRSDIVTGYSPLEVHFEDISICDETDSIKSWSWDFDGDGIEDSNEKNPSFIFDCYNGNSYTVSLTVANESKTVTKTKRDFINVLPAYEKNLARFQKATVSSCFDEEQYSPSNAVDGSMATYWQSAASDSQWILIELDSNYVFGSFILRWGYFYAKRYKICLSRDETTWTDYVSVENGDGITDEFSIVTSDVKYIKIIMTENSLPNQGYRINEIEVYRPETLTETEKGTNNAETSELFLYQNYPNPFNPSTTIFYQISKMSDVQLKIYDILGREINTLVDKVQSAGKHSVVFNGDDLASGIYFYTIKAGKYTQTEKMILMR